MSTGTDLGFNLDEETIELFDAILLNLSQDAELHEEFIKLKFVRKLHDKYDGSIGPIKQILIKLAKIEQDYSTMKNNHMAMQMDLKRAVSDMTEATRTIRTAAHTQDTSEKWQALKKLEGMEHRLKQYSWNHNNGT